MRAPYLGLFIGVVGACSGDPFAAVVAPNQQPASSDAGGGAAAGNTAGPQSPAGGTGGTGGTASSGTHAGGETRGGASTEPSEPGATSGHAGATDDEPGGEGGAAPVACPSRTDGDWELGYFPELRETTSQESHPFFRLTNRGPDVTLDRIVIRYYFTNESRATETATCYWVSGDRCALASMRFGDVLSPTKDASRYLEVSFPEASSVPVPPGDFEVRVGFKTAATDMIQTNDYSFDPSAEAPSAAVPFPYKRWLRATAYVDDELVWGNEPCATAVVTLFEKNEQ